MNHLAAATLSYALASIWLGACLIVAVSLLLRSTPWIEARWRYRVWGAVLITTLVVPGFTMRFAPSSLPEFDPEAGTYAKAEPVSVPSSAGPARNPLAPPVIPAGALPRTVGAPSADRQSSDPHWYFPPAALTLTGLILALGTMVGLLRIPFELRSLGLLKRRADYAPEMLRRLWEEAVVQLPSRRCLRLRVSNDVTLPIACGYFRPAVLVPDGLSQRLSDEETRHLLLHERAHLVRGDDWDLLFTRMAQAFCWWNPTVWWLASRLEQDREEACDQVVVSGAERRRYASTLVHLAEIAKASSNTLAPGATRGELTRRVEALVAVPQQRTSGIRQMPAVLLAGAVLFSGARLATPRVNLLVAPAVPSSSNATGYTIASLDSIFSSYADSGFSGTVLLAQRGRILLEKGYGLADQEHRIPATAETRYSTAGMTKLFTAAALLDLADQGKLSMHDSVGRWFPELQGEKAAVTLDQLLTYRDGLTRLNAPVQRDDPDEFIHALSVTPASFTPGTGYRYSDQGHSLLGLVIEKVTGEEYEGYIRRRFLDPARLSHTGFEDEGGPMATEYSGPANDLQPIGPRAYRWGRRASLGMVSTAGDMYRWFDQITHSTGVSPAVRDAIFQVRGRTDYRSDQAYGLELMDRGFGHRLWRRVAGTPGFEGELIYDPDNDWTAVILVNTRLGWRFRIWSQIERAMWRSPTTN